MLKILWLIPDSSNSVYENAKEIFNSKTDATVELFDYASSYKSLGVKAFESDIVKRCSVDFDVIFLSFFALSFEMRLPVIERIRELTPVVLFQADDEIYLTISSINYHAVVDAVITTDFHSGGLFEQCGVPALFFNLPVTFDYRDSCTKALHESRKEYDFCFVGDVTKDERQIYIRHLKDCGYSVAVAGEGSALGKLPRSETFKLIRRSKVVLNFTGVSVPWFVRLLEPWRDNVKQIKGRPIESALLGTVCLSERAPGLDRLFIENEEILIFDDFQDFSRKANFVRQENKLQLMKARAITRAQRDYAPEIYYGAVIFNLKKILKDRPLKRKSIYIQGMNFEVMRALFQLRATWFFLRSYDLRKSVEAVLQINYGLGLIVGLWILCRHYALRRAPDWRILR